MPTARTLAALALAGALSPWCAPNAGAAPAADPGPDGHAAHHTQPARSAAAAPTHVHYDAPEQFRTPGPDGSLAPRLQNLGTHAFPSPGASRAGQLFMNQGLALTYGFNHLEAGRAFAEAARRDPGNALALWGQALVLGPNINAPMDPAAEPVAHALVQRAKALADAGLPGLSDAERARVRAYVDALAKRYTGKADDRAGSDLAYASAMRALAARYPDDLDVQALFAESLMDLRPWNYWQGDGTPYPETVEIERTLRRVLAADPNHPGALHYWIHLWEPTATPEEAADEADRLVDLMPAAGHLVHMPGHIYVRIGRYQDAIDANQKAVAADEDYITQCRVQGFYPLAYYPHNVHFIWLAASMAGQGALAIEAGDKTASVAPDAALAQVPLLQMFKVIPLFARVQFERWDDLLGQQRPAYDLAYYRGIWHYARGIARLGRAGAFATGARTLPANELAQARAELDALRVELSNPDLAAQPASSSTNSGPSLLRIAERVLAGEIAAAAGDTEAAISDLERAVRYEDTLTYNEPPDWPQPVRQHLGRVLLAAGRAGEAEAVYWEDLRRNRENGWALRGLVQALGAQGKSEQASLVRARLDAAWAAADGDRRLARTAAAP